MFDGVLIDLGNTIVYNRVFDFSRGLKKVYDLAINPPITFSEFLDFNNELKTKTYDNREQQEIKFRDYLNYVISYFHLHFKISLSKLEFAFVSAVEKLELISGASDFLKYCQDKNLKVVVLSNSTFSKEAILKQLQPLKISKYIDCFLISSEVVFRKPSKAFFELGINQFKPKSKIIYIGNDYEIDIIGGSQAGLDTYWFNEHHLPNFQKIDCFEFDNYYTLLQILEGTK